MIEGGGKVAAVTEEEGEAGTAFIVGAFLVVERKMSPEDAADAVLASRPTNPLKAGADTSIHSRIMRCMFDHSVPGTQVLPCRFNWSVSMTPLAANNE